MKAINIYTYSRIQEDMATEYENILSQRSKKLNAKVQEFVAIKTLVDLLLDIEIDIKHFENFFVSFTIEQIGKETELFVRFSTVAGERGAADAERDIRGFAIKFCNSKSVRKEPLLFKTSSLRCTLIYVCGIYKRII